MAISFSDAEQENELITRSTALPEDAGEGSLRPRYLNEYIGQERAKENLRIFIQAAKMRGEALDHVLLHGPPGLGKTTLAAVIANEMGVNMRITSGPTIEKPGDLAALLTNLQENDILFVDEIHRMNRAVEEILYPAMEDHSARSAEIYAHRRDNTLRPAFRAAARPLRRHSPSGAVYAGGAPPHR